MYGTNRPESDEDFLGVFLPSSEDMFSLGNCPTEWTMNEKKSTGARNAKGDVDRKFYSVPKFLNLLGQGQPWALELVFAPQNMIITATADWEIIVNCQYYYLSKNSISPFIGFAKAQAYKATLKGENLNLVRRLIDGIGDLTTAGLNCTIDDYALRDEATLPLTEVQFLGETLKVEQSQYRPGVFMDNIVVAGRKFEFTKKIKHMKSQLQTLEAEYGTRSEAAAKAGYDFKSLLHAYRLIGEAKELLATGKMSMPRPPDEIELLKKIRDGEYEADFFQEIEDRIAEVKAIKSDLPDSANWSMINEVCRSLMEMHLVTGR